MLRLALPIASLAAAAALAVAVLGVPGAAAQAPPTPATEQVLLGAPDPTGPTTRGTFLADPAGQIEHLAGVGHLVAWTVRTPADTSNPPTPTRPKTLPTTTRLVIVDERGGAPLTVDYPGRWVSGLHAFRGPSGPADPQLAVRHCAGRTAARCKVEVLAISPSAPLTLRSSTANRLAAAALRGRIDSGQELVVGRRAGKGKRRACYPRLSVHSLRGDDRRRLRKLPHHPDYPICDGLVRPFLYGRYAFAEVARRSSRFEGSVRFLYGLDLGAGPGARWHRLARLFSSTEYTDYVAIGPGLTDTALVLETAFTDEATTVELLRISLPDHLQRRPTKADQVRADAISPSTGPGCAIAATDGAIYELTSPRCGFGTGTAGEIRRVVNPVFGPAQ